MWPLVSSVPAMIKSVPPPKGAIHGKMSWVSHNGAAQVIFLHISDKSHNARAIQHLCQPSEIADLYGAYHDLKFFQKYLVSQPLRGLKL